MGASAVGPRTSCTMPCAVDFSPLLLAGRSTLCQGLSLKAVQKPLGPPCSTLLLCVVRLL
eukprot:scaffold71422_cov20-Tisochrysis_lutea.AAC.6